MLTSFKLQRGNMEQSVVDQQLDTLFGYIQSMHVMISALIADHPEREGLEAHMDFRIGPARASVVNADRTDLTLEAFDNMTATFKQLIKNPYAGWDDSDKVMQALNKRLRGEGE
jgi:hypothetical protein